MLQLTKSDDKNIGQGECRVGYLNMHEDGFSLIEDLSLKINPEGTSFQSPEFPCKAFLAGISLTTAAPSETVIHVIARLLIVDYLQKNGINQFSHNLQEFPHSGILTFAIPYDKKTKQQGNLICTYVPSIADKLYVENPLMRPRLETCISVSVDPTKSTKDWMAQLIVDYLKINGIESAEDVREFPRTGKFEFIMPAGSDELNCRYVSSPEDQGYILQKAKQKQPKVDVTQLTKAYGAMPTSDSSKVVESLSALGFKR